MIEKHQQTNGIGRGKITINPEYIKRAREITVGGQPVKILSSNPNTGRVLAQFPDGHTEEVKAAPDYFIGGNTSTKELKNNQPIYGETNTAANERADSQDEAHDLTPIFSNLITAGQISTMNEGAQDLQNGKYLEGTTKLFSPAMFGSGIGGIAARSGIGGYNLLNKNGVRKTYNLFNHGHYGEGALSLLGDAFNAAMAAEGLGSISNALKGTSGYRNWRLANAINKGVKENAVITAYNRNPVAKDIGNLWDYQSYLDNVFPNSKVKYVLWHGSRSKNLETFNTNMIGSHMPIKNSVGMYLTPERYTAVGYGTRGSVYPVLLNTENPFITNQFFGGISKNGVNVTKISPKVRRTLLANNDAVIAPRRGEIAFFDPDNALILGSNRDMQGFQKFMKSSPEKRIPHQPQLQYYKQGGKMNTLQFLKNGSGIHIKPKNRGKFTSGGKNGNKPRIVTTGGAGYVPPIDTENIKTDLKNRLYRTISPYTADYNIPYVASIFLKGKDHDYTIDTSPNDEIIRRAPTIDAIWANYLQIPKKDRRYNAVLGKSKYKPSKGNNNSTYYKLPLVDFEKEELIDRTRDLSLNSNKVDSIFSVYGLGDNTIGRGYDNKGEYVSYFDTFDINPFNGKYRGVNIPLLNKLDDIGLGHPLKIYDRIYLDDYYGVPSSGRGGVYLPEVTVYGKTKKKALGGKMNAVEQFKNGSKIHIKKKNKGKFTDYCGGEVTQECIRKAKASGNPTLVKRATFADNARHFKHKDGGKAFVNGVNVLDSNPKMYKYNKKYKMAQEGAKLTFWQQAGNWIKDNQDSISTIGNGISNLISAKNRQDEINQFAQAKQKELKAFKYKTWKDKYLSNLQNQTDRSDIVNAHNAFNQTNINDALQEKQNEINSQIANLQYLNNQQDTGLGDITSGLLGIATNILQGTAKKKKIDNTFSPLANQTMSQIRGKLLDINANFSE